MGGEGVKERKSGEDILYIYIYIYIYREREREREIGGGGEGCFLLPLDFEVRGVGGLSVSQGDGAPIAVQLY